MNFITDNINYITQMIFIILFFLLGFLIIDKITSRINNFLIRTNVDNLIIRLLPLLDKTFKFILVILGLISVLKIHGIDANSVIAGLGVGGLAIGFAARETIANFFGSISLILDRAFKVGDYITINQSVNNNAVEGTVEDINLRSTKIRTLDDCLISIPNNITANSVVVNASSRNKRSIKQTINLTYNIDKDTVIKAVNIIKNILNQHPEILDDPLVRFTSLSAYSLDISFIAYTKNIFLGEYMKVVDDVLLEIFQTFNQENIQFAYPTQTIELKQINNI